MAIFLKMDGVDGESTDDRHHGEIELSSWAFGVSNSGTTHMGGGGAGAGKASFTDVSVTKSVDAATPALLLAAASGKRVKTATVTARKAGADPFEYLTVVLVDVLVTGCSVGGDGEEPPTEHVTLSFGKVQLSYHRQSPAGEGAPDAANRFDWDVTKNARG